MKATTAVLCIVGGVLVVRYLSRDMFAHLFDPLSDGIGAAPSRAGIMRTGAPVRVVRRIADASNRDIVGLVTEAMSDPAVTVEWPAEFDQDKAPRIVWDLLRSLQYTADEESQVVKAPRILLRDGVGDCKSFAVCAAKLLSAAGWNVWCRFVKNEPGENFQHVYCIAERGGQWAVVDGVLDQFDAEPCNFGSIDLAL